MKKEIESYQNLVKLGLIDETNGEEIMNKLLKSVHRYAINYAPSRDSWQTSVPDDTRPEGVRKVSRRKKRDLLKYLMEFYKTEQTYTFDSLYKEFLNYKSKIRAETTIMAYMRTYNRWYKDDPIIYRDLESITTPELTIWLASKVQEGKLNDKAYNKMIAPFSQLCKYACQQKYIKTNPFDYIDREDLHIYPTEKPKSKKKAFSKLESKEINRIALEDFNKKPSAVPLAVLFTFQTGIRLGECAALKWEDIDGDILHVRRLERKFAVPEADFSKVSKYQYKVVDKPKGKFGPREVPLSHDAKFILELLREYYKESGIDSEWLFVSKRYGKIHDRALDIRIRKYCRELGITQKSMHKIRSTYVSMLRDLGMSFEKIAEIVGHKDVRTTQNNYSFDLETDEKNMEYINSLGLLSL